VQALQYFLDNQAANGFVVDRQRNHSALRIDGLCSTSATGMGFIAWALAAAAPYNLIHRDEALARSRAAVASALEVPQDHGIIPHFVDAATRHVHGTDYLSTIDSSWLVAGALCAGALLTDHALQEQALRLYERVDWAYWTAPEVEPGPHLIRHGKGPNGEFLAASWDRLNGETIFMYVLAAGAESSKAILPITWQSLRPFYGTVAGLRFNNADLGLFVFQYGLDLLDLQLWPVPGGIDLWGEARRATIANVQACRAAAEQFKTYRHYWGLSAGDGPAEHGPGDRYRCYTPMGPLDGTAHLTASLASIMHAPEPVLESLRQADSQKSLASRGRYGFSCINCDRQWIGSDMIGIDAGAVVLALDNCLMNGRVRSAFHSLPCVQKALNRWGFQPARAIPLPSRRAA
jgi:hypothetical protein